LKDSILSLEHNYQSHGRQHGSTENSQVPINIHSNYGSVLHCF